jgi:hypothetical protein
VDGCQGLQELPGNPEHGRVIEAEAGPVVLGHHSIESGPKQLEYQTLMIPIGPLMDKGVEQLDQVMGACKSLGQFLMNQ